VFGGDPKVMITDELFLPRGILPTGGVRRVRELPDIDVAAAIIASLMVAGLAVFFNKTRIGRALRAVADEPQGRAFGRHLAQPDLGDRLVRRGSWRS
jgi:branched-chain amino acid transport system permease protein